MNDSLKEWKELIRLAKIKNAVESDEVVDTRWERLTVQSKLEVDGRIGVIKGYTGTVFDIVFDGEQPMMYPFKYLRENAKIVEYHISSY